MSGTEIHDSLVSLISGIEARDVDGFDCFCSDGRAVQLIVVPHERYKNEIDMARVVGHLVDAPPERLADFQNILFEYLDYLKSEGKLDEAVEISPLMSLEHLASLIPEKFIENRELR